MEFKDITKVIKEKYKQYEKIDDEKLYKLIIAKTFKGLFIITTSFEKLTSLFSDLKKDNEKVLTKADSVVNVLEEIKKKISGTPYEKQFTALLDKLDSFSQENLTTQLSEIIEVLNEIKKKQLNQKSYLGGGSPVDTSGIEAKLATVNSNLNNLGGFNIPAYDTQEIDESGAPATTIIAYKKNGVTVATKTISVSGSTTTISVT